MNQLEFMKLGHRSISFSSCPSVFPGYLIAGNRYVLIAENRKHIKARSCLSTDLLLCNKQFLLFGILEGSETGWAQQVPILGMIFYYCGRTPQGYLKGLEQNIFPPELHKGESNVCLMTQKKNLNQNVDLLLVRLHELNEIIPTNSFCCVLSNIILDLHTCPCLDLTYQ